jgi:serine/threonine protein kinase
MRQNLLGMGRCGRLSTNAWGFDDTEKATVVAVVVVGMKVTHSQGIIQRNLKPANILLDSRGDPKTGDLGSSRLLDLGLAMASMIGTPRYMAPEMFMDDEYSPAVDVYSFSLIVCEFLVGETVFLAALGLGVLIVSLNRSPLPDDMNRTVSGIMPRCWSLNPSERDSVEVIFNLLSGIDFQLAPAALSLRFLVPKSIDLTSYTLIKRFRKFH